jgi:hypothetical protein
MTRAELAIGKPFTGSLSVLHFTPNGFAGQRQYYINFNRILNVGLGGAT